MRTPVPFGVPILFAIALAACAADVGPGHAGADAGGEIDASPDAPVVAECSESAPCPEPAEECEAVRCAWDGRCERAAGVAGTVCAHGVCDDSGACVPAGATCEASTDCDDGDPCTMDFCYAYSGTCAHKAIAGCTVPECDSSADCDDGNSCTVDTCGAGKCYHGPASDGGACVVDDRYGRCESGTCAPLVP